MKKSRYTPEFIEKLQQEYDSGMTMRGLIKEYDTSFVSLCKYLDTRSATEVMQRKKKNGDLHGCCGKNYLGSKKHKESAAKGGGFRQNAGRTNGKHIKNIEGKIFYLRSSFEVKVAEWLNERKILWYQPKSITYVLDGKERKYYPDLYIPSKDIYIETKNDYLFSIQQEKMKIVGKILKNRLLILRNKHIEKLNESLKHITD